MVARTPSGIRKQFTIIIEGITHVPSWIVCVTRRSMCRRHGLSSLPLPICLPALTNLIPQMTMWLVKQQQIPVPPEASSVSPSPSWSCARGAWLLLGLPSSLGSHRILAAFT